MDERDGGGLLIRSPNAKVERGFAGVPIFPAFSTPPVEQAREPLMSILRDHRFGRFVVPRAALDDNLGQIIFRDLIPLDVRWSFAADSLLVEAAGPQFEPIPHGFHEAAPFYEVRTEGDPWTSKDGTTSGLKNLRAVFVKKEG